MLCVSLPLKLVAKSGQQSLNAKIDQASVPGNNEASKSTPVDSKIQSTSTKKVTIDSNRPCVNLIDLFPEFSSSYSAANGNILAAQFFGHAHVNVTIQAAKTGANRYRLQSDSSSSDYLSLLTREFISRLFKSQSGIELTFSADQLPVDELSRCINKHLELRHTLNFYKEAIEKCGVQFRAIQKRLLVKFKVRNKFPKFFETSEF